MEELKLTLQPLVRNQTLDLWDDTQIAPGAVWREEIRQALNSACVAVLLVSKHFLASDFVVEHELPSLLKAAEEDGLKIIWICVGACLFEDSEFAKYQAAHNISQPLNSLSLPELENVLVKISKVIETSIIEAAKPQVNVQHRLDNITKAKMFSRRDVLPLIIIGSTLTATSFNSQLTDLYYEVIKSSNSNSSSEHLSFALSYLENYFKQIRIERSHLLCVGLRDEFTSSEFVDIRFEVRRRKAFMEDILIHPREMNELLNELDKKPVIFLLYLDSETRYPEYFLIFHEWVVTHVNDIDISIENNISIPVKDFKLMNKTKFLSSLKDEISRFDPFSNNNAYRITGAFSHKELITDFSLVVRKWEKRRFNTGSLVDPILSSLLENVRKQHPRSRLSDNEFNYPKAFLYQALHDYSQGKNFRLATSSNDFSTVFLGSARALASNYPIFLKMVEYKLEKWQTNLDETNVAILMSSAIGSSDPNSENILIVKNMLLKLLEDAKNLKVKSLETYRLKHHLYQALTEVTGEMKYANKAISLALNHPDYQIEHLFKYQWLMGRIGGSPEDVARYYELAGRNNQSLRGSNSMFYNQGMQSSVLEFIDEGYFDKYSFV